MVMTALMAPHHTDPPDPPDRQPRASNDDGAELITHAGETRTILEWSKKVGISKTTLYHRIKTYHWPLEDALKPGRRSRPPTYLHFMTAETPDGPVTKPMSEWSKELGIKMPTISRRLSRGWTDSQALGFAPSPSELWHRERQAQTEASADPFEAEIFDADPFQILPKED